MVDGLWHRFAADFDRLAALRFGASVERRLGGAHPRVAIWLPAWLADHADLDGTTLRRAGRAVWSRACDPATIYRDDVDSAPPALVT
jgi:hypothetical protein